MFLLVAGGAAAAESDSRTLLARAYALKGRGDLTGLAAAFRAAAAAGADRQRVMLELGYVEMGLGQMRDARGRFTDAGQGPDPALAAQARRQIDAMPSHLWADAYADALGWRRVAGGHATTDLVPTVRLRAYLRPSLDVDAQAYLFAQATRDLASEGLGAAGVPQIYADDYAMAGGGVLWRLLGRRVGLFAQAGPAVNLLDDGRQRIVFDARGGAFGAVESDGCVQASIVGVRVGLRPCHDVYAEAVYVSRFHHNAIGFARGRSALGYLQTGRVAWQVVGEVRAAKDRNDDYFNNFADAGLGHRWRLLAPARVDLLVGAHAGRYFGLAGRDPAPDPLWYADLRIQAATYLEF